MNAISIRRAEPDDAPAIVSLLRELAAYEKLEDKFHLTEALARRDMLGAVAHSELAIAEGEAVGVAVWFWVYRSFCARRGLFVEDLYVRPHLRGCGIGRALLAHLARVARDADADGMEWLVLDWNAPSQTFYQGLGARRVEDWRLWRLERDAMLGLAAS